MYAIEVKGKIETHPNLPKKWVDENGTHLNIGDGSHLGFKKVVYPKHNTQIEVLENIHLDGDVYTYDVKDAEIPYTELELKGHKIQELGFILSGTLANTDWYIIREADSGKSTPQKIKDDRAAIRLKGDKIKKEINALTTKKEIITYTITI